MCMTETA